jgi:NADP-dependent 3-hydroxy acid dehydrogenase YdfG
MKKSVLITGSSSGIGRATAIYFNEQGWNVSATMRNPEKDGIEGILCPKLDVTDPLTIKSAINTTLEKFHTIDVIVNNAGYSLMGPLELASEEQIKRQFSVNVFGVMNVIREILPHFRKNNAGTIINVSSIGGKITFPLLSFYQGTKFAMHGFSEGLQFELKQFNIKIKIIEPGIIKTDFYGRSMDIAKNDNIHAYDKYIEAVKNGMKKSNKMGNPPINTAKVIFKAASDNRWKMHYSSGIDAKMLLFMRKILPVRMFNKLIESIMK